MPRAAALESLYLASNAMTEREAGKLAQALGQAQQLREVDVLAGNAPSLAGGSSRPPCLC